MNNPLLLLLLSVVGVVAIMKFALRQPTRRIVLVVGCMITGFALWFTTRGVDWRAFGQALAAFEWLWLIPALITFYYSMYLRGLRWGLLFRPHHHLSGVQMFRPTMICFAFNSVLPGRVGEVVRAVLVGKRYNTGISTAIATVLAERIFDAVCLLGLLSASLSLLELPTDQTFSFGEHTMNVSQGIDALTRVSLVLAGCVVLFMIPAAQRLAIHMAKVLPGLSTGLKQKIAHTIEQFARGFGALTRPLILAQIVLHSALIWFLIAASNWCVAKGFNLEMSMLEAAAVMTLIGIFIIIPAAPGYWGLYEAGGVFSIVTILGLTDDKALALAYTLMTHLVQYVPIVVIGLIFAAQSQVKTTAALPATDAEAPVSTAQS